MKRNWQIYELQKTFGENQRDSLTRGTINKGIYNLKQFVDKIVPNQSTKKITAKFTRLKNKVKKALNKYNSFRVRLLEKALKGAFLYL